MELTQLPNKSEKRQRKKPAIDLSTMVYGKLPPQAKDLEEAVLGAVMLDKSAFDTAIEILKPGCFYVDAHQRIFRAFQSLAQKSLPIDILTVVEELKISEELEMVGGPYYVTKLTNAVVSTANLEAHARIVMQKFIQRELIRVSGEIIAQAYEESTDVFDLMDDAERAVNTISMSTLKQSYHSLEKPVKEVMDRVVKLQDRKDNTGITGVPTGLLKLDGITAGWQPTDLIIVAARPSVGKSAFGGNLAINAVKHEIFPTPVGIFSLEMSAAQWAARFLSAESQIDSWKINRGIITDEELKELGDIAYKRVSQMNIFIDDTPGIDVFELKAKARKMVKQDKVGLIIIDYLQLMSGLRGKNENREQEISSISRNLKGLAKELNVPIIALSQLSRGVEKTNREPLLSDLRESGALEQDSDVVIFLIKPDDEDVKRDAFLKDSILVKIAKHRSGPLDKISIRFVKEIQKTMGESEYENYMFCKRSGLKRIIPDGANSDDTDEELPF